VDYDWEIWNRKFRDVNRNNQHSIRNRLEFEFNLSGNDASDQSVASATPQTGGTAQAVQPKSRTILRLKLDHTYADRRAIAYNTQPLTFVSDLAGSPANGPSTAWVVTSFTTMNDGFPIEFNLLRRFDETGRLRNDGTFTLELLKGEKTNFSASYRYLEMNTIRTSTDSLQSLRLSTSTHACIDNERIFMPLILERTTACLSPCAPGRIPASPGAIVQGTLAQYPIANTRERTSRSNLGFNSALTQRLKDG
jgi:hypothetical protein